MPNSIAVIFFTIWPLLIIWFLKKYTVKQAIFISISLASLLLPVNYIVDYPLLPPLDKNTITSLSLMVLLFIKKEKNPIFKSGTWNKFFIIYLIIIVISTLLNNDAFKLGGVSLPASRPYDALSDCIKTVLWFMPFIFGRNLLNNVEDTEYMFKTLTIIALIYSIPMLYEIRMSPQLHTMLYGYFPGGFNQNIRADGFRPVVFIGHGLTLSFWFVTCSIAALALYKSKAVANKFFGWPVIAYFIVLLVLCKTVSALIYLLFSMLLILFLKEKKQLIVALTLPLLVMIYPFNASTQLIKNSDIISFVQEKSVDRAQSLETRFNNEEMLLARALERPFFGWSGWGRNRIYDNGKDITITDGQWIIQFGIYGGLGFLFYYLLLIYPIFFAMRSYKYISEKKHQVYFTTLAIILAVGIFDSVPNTSMSPLHFLLAGALLGQSESLRKQYLQKRFEEITSQAAS